MYKLTGHDHFTISRKYKRLKDVLDAKARKGEKSDWMCRILLKEWDNEQAGSKIDEYYAVVRGAVTPPKLIPLDTWKYWTRADLDKVDPEELQDLYRTLSHNKEVLGKYLDVVMARLE